MNGDRRSIPRLLRFADLKAAGVVKNWPQLKRLVDGDGFPPGFMLSANTRVWDETEVAEWIEARRSRDA